MCEDFYVFLSSNVKSRSQERNTLSKFVTHLTEKQFLDNEYKVALAEISYPKAWLNISKPETISVVIVDTAALFFSQYTLPSGLYKTYDQIATAINTIINGDDNKEYRSKNIEKNPILSYDSKSDKFTMTIGYTINTFNPLSRGAKYIVMSFSDNLSEMLGFVDFKMGKLSGSNYESYSKTKSAYGKTTILEGKFSPQLNSISTLYVYSDIIEPGLVGNVKAPLLRQVEVPSEKKYGEDCAIKFKKLYYHPLNHFEIDSIRIEIRDVSGELVEFTKGEVKLTLHFNKQPDPTKLLKKILRK